MRIRQVGSAVGTPDGHQNLTTFLINDSVAIDAGALGYVSPLSDQRRVEHVFLSHSHMDHIGSLPIFLDNVFQPGETCPTIHVAPATWEVLARDVLNDRVWPDLARLSAAESPFYRQVDLIPETPVKVGSLTITPISVNHVVPTLGFLIQEAGGAAALFLSDSGPTDRIWEIANQTPHLKYVFMECSFPNSKEWLALRTGHLSPALFAQEVQKLIPPVEVVAVHIKTGFFAEIVQELQALGIDRLQIGGADRTWMV